MESFLTDLKKQVQCSLCNDTLSEPKILKCFHTFRKPCIKSYALLIDEVNVFKCPQCNSLTPLSELNSVEDLKPSLLHSRVLKGLALVEGRKVCSVSESHSPASWYCFDCDHSLCQECRNYHSFFMKDHKVVCLSDLKKEDIELIITRESHCRNHPSKRLELFCENCEAVICLTCLKDNHKGHFPSSLDEIVSRKKTVLLKHLEVIENLMLNGKEKQEHEEIAYKIKQQGEKALQEIQLNTKKMIETLRQNERELTKQVVTSLEKAERNLNIIHHMPAVKEYINNAMEIGLASEEMEFSENFMFCPLPQHSKMIFVSNRELAKQVNLGLGEIVADQLTEEVQVNGNHVSNSPLIMNVQPQTMKITKQFKIKGLNTLPERVNGVAVNEENSRIAVADESAHCVYVFNTDEDLLLTYGGLGDGEGELSYPKGLAFLNDTDLVIADCKNNRICIVNTTTGALIKTFGNHGNGVGEFACPRGVHVDDDGNIIVCDTGNHRVQVFTKDGDYQYQFGLTTHGIFIPVSTVTHGGRFYVSDLYNGAIRVFEKTNGVLTTVLAIGGHGTNHSYFHSFFPSFFLFFFYNFIDLFRSTDGQLIGPWGLAIDNDRHLLVCDPGNNCIQKFTLDGRFLGKTSEAIEAFYVTVMNDGQLLVTTPKNGMYFVE